MHTYMKDFPTDIKSFVVEDANGEYTIYLNSRFTREQNQQAYLHEMQHITHDDMHCMDSADEIEDKRHNI